MRLDCGSWTDTSRGGWSGVEKETWKGDLYPVSLIKRSGYVIFIPWLNDSGVQDEKGHHGLGIGPTTPIRGADIPRGCRSLLFAGRGMLA